MGKTMIRFKSTEEDIRAIRKFLDTHDNEDTRLALDILGFLTDWHMERNGEKDAHYHHNIYSILCMIGCPPKMDRKTHKQIIKKTKIREEGEDF